LRRFTYMVKISRYLNCVKVWNRDLRIDPTIFLISLFTKNWRNLLSTGQCYLYYSCAAAVCTVLLIKYKIIKPCPSFETIYQMINFQALWETNKVKKNWRNSECIRFFQKKSNFPSKNYYLVQNIDFLAVNFF
jgi:hypothetical protein